MISAAEKKIESDDPILKARGFEARDLIRTINKLIEIDGEKMTDGELVDEIYQTINK
jgi:hypothetical protein|tara:strand:+ start:1314 stop:1484 length:171 start_codon:yes stop_codon:yes gene_type:complete